MVRLLPRVGLLFDPNAMFQSHNGAIAARCPINSDGNEISFNPTMVRLLPIGSKRKDAGARFQSHNGAIAATDMERSLLLFALCFNPTMVRLLRV